MAEKSDNSKKYIGIYIDKSLYDDLLRYVTMLKVSEDGGSASVSGIIRTAVSNHLDDIEDQSFRTNLT